MTERDVQKGTTVNTKLLAGKAILVTLTAISLAGCLGSGKKDPSQPTTDSGTGSTPTTPITPTTPPPPPTISNNAPTISGSPLTVAKVGISYAYQPTASDPEGDPLTFQINNKPSWASFNSSTGRLEGIPPEGSNGTTSAVQITVTDGKANTAAAPFDITVTYPTVGSTTLAWQPPSTNEDGTPLADLAGYVVRYGRDPGLLDQQAKISNPGVTQYVVENLVEGVWYFSLSSLNTTGVESRPTGVVSTTIG